MLTLLRQLSARHLRNAPLRSLLVMLGITLGTAVYVASRATSDSMADSFSDLVQRVAGRADLMVVGGQSGIPGELLSTVAEVPGVAHAASALEITTQMVDGGEPLLVLGVDFLGDTHFLPFQPKQGEASVIEDPLAFANDPTALLVTETLAKRRGLAVDDEIRLLTANGPKAFTVWGVLEDTGPVSSFGGQVAVMFIDAAQVAFARGTLVDRIDVSLDNPDEAAAVAQRVGQAVEGRAHVEQPEQIGERLRELSGPLRSGLGLSGLVALMVGMFIIYNAIGVSVAQRRREVGLMRALGVLRRSVVASFCMEAVLLAVPGTLLGFVLAEQLIRYTSAETLDVVNRVYTATPSTPEISLNHVLQGLGLGLTISWLAAYLPARRGARMDPVEALRPGSAVSSGSTVPYKLLGLLGAAAMVIAPFAAQFGTQWSGGLATLLNVGGAAALAPALVVGMRRLFVGPAEALLGLSGRLGLDYVERNLGRSSINVLALMVAVSMSVSVGGWLNSFEHSIRSWFEQITAADLTVTAGSPFVDRRHVPLAADTAERLKGIPGLSEVQPVRIVEQQINEGTFTLMASDTTAFLRQAHRRNKPWKILEGKDPVAPEELAAQRLIVLGENTAHHLGVGAGEVVTLPTPSGPLEFTVRAVVVDYSSEKGAGFIDRRHYLEHWKDDALDGINLYLDDGADVAAAQAAVRERLGGGEGLFVTATTDLREQFLGLVEDSFSYTQALEMIVLLIALLGVIGTMVSAVLDRVREIGMIRAVGAMRSQITAALVVEAAFLGFCAVVGGILTGAVQCKLFLETLAVQQAGWHLEFVFPWEASLRIGLLVVATAALAGLLPGLRAARLDVKEALAYE